MIWNKEERYNVLERETLTFSKLGCHIPFMNAEKACILSAIDTYYIQAVQSRPIQFYFLQTKVKMQQIALCFD